ncbi:MAG TPA: hypothetical protein VKN99_24715 [Polyangia bacterium]|nr:hypothetical protein [Polyangia bacterium]
MPDHNPYEAPKSNVDPAAAGGAEVAPCPKCRNTAATKVRFTWWGGLLGARMFSVVQCTRCSCRFNGKTGAGLTGVIIAYQGVVLGILLLAMIAYYVVAGGG